MSPAEQRQTGRPRDPEIRTKALLAAQRVYVRAGRAGFTFEAIAREAGVGKPALYRRWATAEELMRDVLRSHVLVGAETPDSGIREQLTQIALATLRLVQSEQGTFILRVSSEREAQPELFGRYFDRLREVIHTQNRGLVEKAVARGELADDCDADALLLSITGAMLVGALMGFAPDPAADAAGASQFCRTAIEQVLRGVLPAVPAHRKD
ncbi:AcrR family transcriptional regulator [Microbacterium sp. SORGH_AS428]|uniref:TetR/AcrR family transcriptional regulator n=1 Tax=Microbacterium sp. SORGH_AS_0428 TaxID=3041788 RepID=UPI00285EA019|nr:TetR/AcrR family transcriptional regulator [Microbacterium sp. SORGH_AS_0428]MDR6199164.1 AcrR family transcriptional regulator [Microbacterium sp. SORGH_AS_0428]